MFKHFETSLSGVLAITARTLCPDGLPEQLTLLAAAHPAGIVLREPDLPPEDYAALAMRALEICRAAGTPCILHRHIALARRLACPAIHLPLPVLCAQPDAAQAFETVGVSVHSVEQAQQAAALGATYLTFGHVFPSTCKPGLPPRGLEQLRAVCRAVSIPVWALGGLTPDNAAACLACGARGAAVRSGLMTPQGLRAWIAKPAGL